MTEAHPHSSITAWRSNALLRLETARASGAPDEARKIVDELERTHVALGERRIGTNEEQRTYLLARSTGTPLPELAAAGINTNLWPPPPHSSPALAEPLPAAPATEARITSLFAAAGSLRDRRPAGPRYEARHRPEDGQRYKGQPLPWAIWDTVDNLPIAYHGDQELTEYQAGRASERYAARGRPT